MVVESAHMIRLYLASVESATLSTTQHTIMVVQSLIIAALYLASMEPITFQQIMLVVQST